MAAKKPAKRNIANAQEKKVELPGKIVMYYGTKDKPFECPSCKRELVKGIIYEHNNSTYCTRTCIPKEVPVTEWV